MAAIDLVISQAAGDLASARVVSTSSEQRKTFRQLIAGDKYSLQLRVKDAAGDLVDLTGYTIRCGLGGINSRPTGGTFTLTDGTDTTSALTYDESAADIQTALNALNASAGPYNDTVTVTGSDGGPWVIKFDTNGAQSNLTGTFSSLTPDSSALISELVTGDGSTREEQMLRINQSPIAYTADWTISTTTATATLDLNTEGVFTALGSASSTTSTFEIELTDGSGNIQTILQAPVSIGGEINNSGSSGSPDFDTYLSSTAIGNKFRVADTLFVDDEFGNNSTAARERRDLPYATVAGANGDAASGDTIVLTPGSHGAFTPTAAVRYHILPGAQTGLITATAGASIYAAPGASVQVDESAAQVNDLRSASLRHVDRVDSSAARASALVTPASGSGFAGTFAVSAIGTDDAWFAIWFRQRATSSTAARFFAIEDGSNDFRINIDSFAEDGDDDRGSFGIEIGGTPGALDAKADFTRPTLALFQFNRSGNAEVRIQGINDGGQLDTLDISGESATSLDGVVASVLEMDQSAFELYGLAYGSGTLPSTTERNNLLDHGFAEVLRWTTATVDRVYDFTRYHGEPTVADQSGNDSHFTADGTSIAALLPRGERTHITVAASNETSDLVTGTAAVTFRMPYAMELDEVRASVNTAPVGSTIIADINEGGSTILSTKLTIDASEKTSTTAATPAVISDTTLADDAEITIDIDQVGSSTAGKGLKITLIGWKTG